MLYEYQEPLIEKASMAEVKVSYKKGEKPTDFNTYKIAGSDDSADYLKAVWDYDTIDYLESFVVLFLSRGNKVIGWARISTGGCAHTLADPKVIFSMALTMGAPAIILSHNHPSGNLKPSPQDLQMTRKLVDAGKLLEIQVLDHIIITSDSHFSFLLEGLI